MYISSHEDGMRQPSRRKTVLQAGKKKVRDSLRFHRNTKLHSHNIHAEGLGQTPPGFLIFSSPHESWSVDSVGCVLVILMTNPLWLLQSSFPLLRRTPWALPNVWLGTQHLFPSVAGWSLSGLFDEDSVRFWSQNILQAGQTLGSKVLCLGWCSNPSTRVSF